MHVIIARTQRDAKRSENIFQCSCGAQCFFVNIAHPRNRTLRTCRETGDTIHVEMEVIEARLTKTRPDRGLVRTRNEVKRHDGTVLLTYTPLRLLKAHGGG